MTRRLFIHLGPAKTGTSAIQHVLSRHDGSAVLYPNVGLWSDGSHHGLVMNFFGAYRRPDLVREDPERLIAQIGEQARASDRDLVISSEFLPGCKDLGRFVSALKSAIGGSSLRVLFVVVVREHRERAASLYNQRVKDAVSAEIRTPDAFLVDHPQKFCYENLLRRLASMGQEISVLNYHPAESLVARCLALLGLPPDAASEPPRRNVSLGRKALIAMLAANRAAQSREERVRFELTRISDRFAPSEVFFSQDAISEVRSNFADDRKFLRRQYGIVLPRPERPICEPRFALSGEEFREVAALTRKLGDYGARIEHELRTFAMKAEDANA